MEDHDMPLADELRERNGSTIEAAMELVRGLMRGHRPELKLGYSWENAASAAERMFDLPKLDAHEVRFYAVGFARGMHGAQGDGEAELVDRMAGVSERFSSAYVGGRTAGLCESDEKYPAGLPDGIEVIDEAEADDDA